jgi:hypothetical protein
MLLFYHMKELLQSLKTVEKPKLKRMTNNPSSVSLDGLQNVSANCNINEFIDLLADNFCKKMKCKNGVTIVEQL